MNARINFGLLSLVSLVFLTLTFFVASQVFQPTVAEAVSISEPTYEYSLTKKFSEAYPVGYTADMFTFDITGTSASGTPVSMLGIPLTEYTLVTATAEVYLPIGTYTISENGPVDFVPGEWTVKWGGYGCDSLPTGISTEITVRGDISADVCSADNQWRPGNLFVEKRFVGTSTAFENFNFTVTDESGERYDGPFDAIDGINEFSIAAGDYSVAEDSYAGYTATYSENCTGTIAQGGSATCRITNTWIGDTVPGTCDDGIQNQDETGVDTGGVCGVPTPSCSDGIQNQDETGIDTGGVCGGGGGDQCVDETLGSWADAVVSSNQGDTKSDGAITNPDRTDPEAALGASDWTPNTNDSTGFFSLGFGGSIVLSFDSYVPNVAGTDLTVYEATNGDTYPAETATVEVSQNGSDWFLAGTADNSNQPSRTTAIDFDSTGLDWIMYVRITDTSDADLYEEAAADGFDLVAVEATQQLCDEPTDGGGGNGNGDDPTYLVFGYVWHDQNSNTEWEGFMNAEATTTEPDLSGWTVRITNGETTYSTTTNAEGYYYFYVPVGTWTINEVIESGWNKTFPVINGHIVNVLGPVTQAEQQNFFAMVMNFIIPTVYAQTSTTTTYGPYNFGNVYSGTSYSQGSYGGGGSSSPVCRAFDATRDGGKVVLTWDTTRGSSMTIDADGDEIFATTNDHEVDEGSIEVDYTGDTDYELTVSRGTRSDTCDTSINSGGDGSSPAPQVLGEQVSAIPLGAANAGAGGAAPVHVPTPSPFVSALLAMAPRRND